MLELTEDLFLGKGCHKAAYLHPEDDTKCVKVLICEKPEAKKQLKREIKHNLALQKRHAHLPEVAKYRGTVETNLGTGYIWDIVRDADGSISISLEQYIKAGEFLKDDGDDLHRMLLELRAEMLKKKIIPMDLEPYNLLCQKGSDEKIKLVIIDDIGTAALIPFEYYFSFAARSRIKRRWNRMSDGVMRDYHSSEEYRAILEKVRL